MSELFLTSEWKQIVQFFDPFCLWTASKLVLSLYTHNVWVLTGDVDGITSVQRSLILNSSVGDSLKGTSLFGQRKKTQELWTSSIFFGLAVLMISYGHVLTNEKFSQHFSFLVNTNLIIKQDAPPQLTPLADLSVRQLFRGSQAK